MGTSMNPMVAGTSNRNFDLTKTVTFTGAAGLGAIGNGTLFTISGQVMIESVVAYCTDSVTLDGGTGAATLSLGVVNDTDLFVAATVPTAIDTGMFWVSATPTANGIALPAAGMGILISQNVVFAVTNGAGNQVVNGGTVRFDVVWSPVTEGATLS